MNGERLPLDLALADRAGVWVSVDDRLGRGFDEGGGKRG